MPRSYEPYVPKDLVELYDYIGSMMLRSPKFVDRTGYFPEQNIDTVFVGLSQALTNLRGQLGGTLYNKLNGMSDKMRGYFEADPEDTGEAIKGRQLILDMEDLLKAHLAARRAR